MAGAEFRSEVGSGNVTQMFGLALKNLGTLSVQSGTVDLSDGLTSDSFSGTTLSAGTYIIHNSILQFPKGTSIDTNEANLTLDGSLAKIIDETTPTPLDVLANFSTNASGASLTLLDGKQLSVPGPTFSNSGA